MPANPDKNLILVKSRDDLSATAAQIPRATSTSGKFLEQFGIGQRPGRT